MILKTEYIRKTKTMPILIKEDCIDDLIHSLHAEILENGSLVSPTKGENYEILGAYLVLTNPISRISRTESRSKIISCLGELLWYFSGQNELGFIKHYIPNYHEFAEVDDKVHGGYGPRIMNMHGNINQLKNIINTLKKKNSTRRTVIQLFDAKDLVPEDKNIEEYKDIPCTISLQFIIRENKLELFVNMRSNDAFKGFTHDVFAFTMLQEFVARLLKCELGNYHHYVASMHIYKSDVDKIKNLQNEGFMSTKPLMREMPNISGLDFIDKIMTIEKLLREDKMLDIFSLDIDDYWKDLFRIIKIYFLLKSKNQVDKIFADYEIKQLSNTNYRLFFESR